MITAVLLAAGAARRFGAPKLLEELHGKPLVRWSVECLQGPPVDGIIVVVPPEHAAIRDVLREFEVRFVVNPIPDAGIGRSLACAIEAVDAATSAVLVALADEPLVQRDSLLRVVERYRGGARSIVVPRFRGTRGHPVLFDRTLFPELVSLTGDQGARSVTDKDPARVAIVELDQAKPIDVDTPSDLSRLRSAVQFTSPSHTPEP